MTTKNDERVVSLLPFELSMPIMTQQFSTASLTWYQMDKDQSLEQVATSVKSRLTEMLKANPWLGGRIKTRNWALAIVYHDSDDNINNNNNNNNLQAGQLLTVYTKIRLSMDTPYPEASALLQETTVPLSLFWLWNRDVPFFRVALVQDYKDPQRFALVTSLAHCVGDGKTYYNLHNMIASSNNGPSSSSTSSSPDPVVALNITRKHHLHDAMTKTMGGPAFFGCYCDPSIGFVIRVIRSCLMALFIGPPTTVKLFWVNKEWIKEEKKAGILAIEDATNTTDDPTDVDKNYKPEFLSSNDVMASKFLRTTKCDQGLMTVNFRGKIPDCHENDAGNYYNFNPLRCLDFSTPVAVRQVVNQLKLGQRHPKTQPLSSLENLCSIHSPISFFTNWADFAKPVPLKNAKQLLHMPLVPTHSVKMPARLYSICYVFKPTKECDKLGVMVSATPKVMKELEATGMMGPELAKNINGTSE